MKTNIIRKSLSQVDAEILQFIYSYRCLTQPQLADLYELELARKDDVEPINLEEKINNFLSKKLIEKEEQYADTEPVYFLTSDGISFIRNYLNIPIDIYDSTKGVVRRGYYRASELRIHPKYINHQKHLNQFVIDFTKQHPELNCRYYDEKYLSQYSGIRPDGMFTVLDTDFFLEMDMSTESKRQLCEKWENYRNFLLSREYAYRERNIIVLFIVENTNRMEERIDLVQYTIFESLLDIIDVGFEIYVGSREEILNLMTKKLLPAIQGSTPITRRIRKSLTQKLGFNTSIATRGKILDDTDYSLYLFKAGDPNNIAIENGRLQEFLLDDYYFKPVSILKKLAYYERNNGQFRRKYGRDISYIIVAESEEQIYLDLKLVDLLGVKNVYFTTIERLDKFSFAEALFKFDFLGNIHHFKNNGLNESVFERNIHETPSTS